MANAVYDRLTRNEYKNCDPCPVLPRKPIPVFTTSDNSTDFAEYAAKLAAWEDDCQTIEAEYRVWAATNQKLHAQFRIDLELETGMTGHPKADLLYYKACDLGEHYGNHEVYSYYIRLLDLVK